MFTAEEFRAKAMEYTQQMKNTADPAKLRDLQRLEQSFAWLADNEEWLADILEKSIHSQATGMTEGVDQDVDRRTGAEIEEHILRCLGAAVIMQWNGIPTKLQRELFDTAGSMGELLKTGELRGQIARFLHNHKDADALSAS